MQRVGCNSTCVFERLGKLREELRGVHPKCFGQREQINDVETALRELKPANKRARLPQQLGERSLRQAMGKTNFRQATADRLESVCVRACQ